MERQKTATGDSANFNGDDDGGKGGGDFENFVAFDEVQRRERVWERVVWETVDGGQISILLGSHFGEQLSKGKGRRSCLIRFYEALVKLA
ncbi:hypothetical protein FOZ62_003291 [Perkinsus olseni]|uniref:Uncharacterized protein n=1 Tax=Perkinsus olseni TaxID=32597 RepID=A0A7J6PQ91_PEROL|nr:hypothetical protein FOZ62_003291 [Perkinsus olseni]